MLNEFWIPLATFTLSLFVAVLLPYSLLRSGRPRLALAAFVFACGTAFCSLASAASGDVLVLWPTERVALTAAQKTALGNHVATNWVGVHPSKVLAMQCSRTDATIECWPTISETLDQASLFALLVAGQTVSPGMVNTARKRDLSPLAYTGARLTALRNFVAGLFPETTGLTVRSLYCDRDAGSGVYCSALCEWPRNAAQAWADLQAGATLAPVGVVP